jgi:hypothetical protein
MTLAYKVTEFITAVKSFMIPVPIDNPINSLFCKLDQFSEMEELCSVIK